MFHSRGGHLARMYIRTAFYFVNLFIKMDVLHVFVNMRIVSRAPRCHKNCLTPETRNICIVARVPLPRLVFSISRKNCRETSVAEKGATQERTISTRCPLTPEF